MIRWNCRLYFFTLCFLFLFKVQYSRKIESDKEDQKDQEDGVAWSNFEEITFEDFRPIVDKNSGNESEWHYEEDEWAPWKPYIGVGMCLLSSILCGLSYPVKRYAIKFIDLSKVSKSREKFAYVTDKTWLLGQSFIFFGELLHYFAFYFAQAIVVCTVQILTVLVAAFASSKLLDEKTNQYSRVGIALALSGCWLVTFNAPSEEPIYSSKRMLAMLLDPSFLSFLISALTLTLVNGLYVIPKYGDKNSFYYTFETALLGSIIMVGIKGMALIFTEGAVHWLPWVCFLALSICLVLQISYINSALERYNTLAVTIQFYMSYSACTIIASTLLFKLWKRATWESVMSNVVGLVNIVLGVLLYTIFEVDHNSGLTLSVSNENNLKFGL